MRLVQPAARAALTLTLTVALTAAAWAIGDADLDRASRTEAAAAEARYGVILDAAPNQRVHRIFDRIVAASRKVHWQLGIKILGNPSVNAFAYPNGQVYVDRGLLDVGVTDDELAFVLGHEVAHVTLQHARHKLENAALSGFLISILTQGKERPVRFAGQLLQGLLQSGYSREAESEADTEGLEVTARAGYEPAAALTFFVKLQKAAKGSPGLRIFPTHPLTEERIRRTQDWLARRPGAKLRSQPTSPALLPGSRPAVARPTPIRQPPGRAASPGPEPSPADRVPLDGTSGGFSL